MSEALSRPWPVAAGLVAHLAQRGETVAVAESLTGGLVAARLVDVPGASSVLRGGVVAYATELKHTLLGVDADLLHHQGAVDPQVARAMADGVARRLGATWGLSTTGVAGPADQDGMPPGTVFVAVHGPGCDEVLPLVVPGSREEIREGAVREALGLLARACGCPT